VLVFPAATPEMTAELMRALPVPICVLGHAIPGTAFTLSTGWGWIGAAQLHLERARKLFETGTLDVDISIDGKESLIEQDVYDALIGDWAKRTGRPVR
jgi:methylisocitrate lyase